MELSSQTEQFLRNPVWHALNTKHAHLAVGGRLAKRYPAEVVGAVALADYSPVALGDLAQIVDAGEIVFTGSYEPPHEMPGWTIHGRYTVLQMVSMDPGVDVETGETILNLTAADVPEMDALVRLAEPGPFAPRAIELGRYIGIRKEGQLVAMAGERFSPPGCQELCTVCTHPDHRRKGYASLLVRRLLALNWQEGNVVFLHEDPAKTDVRRLYEELGFRVHFDFTVMVISR